MNDKELQVLEETRCELVEVVRILATNYDWKKNVLGFVRTSGVVRDIDAILAAVAIAFSRIESVKKDLLGYDDAL